MAPLFRFKAAMASLVLFVPSMLFLARSGRRGEALGAGRGLRAAGPLGSGPPDQAHVPSSTPPVQSHVRVVVRTQPREELLLRSLIYSLRAQAHGHSWLTVDFVLVPTEPGSLPVYQTLRQEMNPGFDDIEVLALPDTFYPEAKASNPFNCTASARAAYLRKHTAADVHKICDYDHYVYYAATDRALQELVVPCATCTHVLVTNGDNGYAPDFLGETTKLLADLVAVGFAHAKAPYAPQVKLGQIDLGAVIMRTRVLDGGKRVFMTSLPKEAGAKEVHDADYWFVKTAVDRGMKFNNVLAEQIMMYHH